MSLAALLSQTVTVVKMDPTGSDDFGNPVPAEASRKDYPGLIQQTDAREVVLGRETRVSDWKLFLESDVAIDALDKVEEGGRVFEVVGPPYITRTPRGPHHTEARLSLIEG